MSNSIGRFYSDFIKEKYIKDNLKKGSIPTSDDINIYMKEMIERNNSFSSPMLKSEIYYIDNEEDSSVKKMNTMMETLETDLSVSIKALLEQGNKISSLYDSTFTRLKSFEFQIGSLKNKISSLLFSSKNTDRHEALFHEKFESTDMIDLNLSTAEIDDTSNSVTLKTSESNYIPIPRSGLEVSTDANSSITSSTDLSGLEVSNLTDSSNMIWQRQVKASSPLAQVYVDLIVNLSSNSSEINKIILDPANVNLKTQINAELFYSNDKLNWLYPDGETKKRIAQKTTFDFSNVSASYWKIRLTKYGNDGFFGDSYVYNFGLKNLLLLGKTYKKIDRQDRSLLYSKIIDPQSLNAINAVNIQVCDTQPQNTQIIYELAPLTQNQIDDCSNTEIEFDVNDLYFYPLDFSDVDSVTLDFLKLAANSTQEDVTATETITYLDKGEFDYCLDLNLDQIGKGGISIMRGKGYNEASITNGKSDTIKGAPVGWKYNGVYYSTYVLIETKDGEVIDLGDTEMIVNGSSVSGKVLLNAGVNHIVSPKKYWKSIDLSTLPQSTTYQIDPLYPYNHKYLIEGIGDTLHNVDTTQSIDEIALIDLLDSKKVYRKQRSYWDTKMREESFGNFESESESALDVFAYREDNNNNERIVVKSTLENELMNRETFSIISKIQSSKPIKGLIFKAELLTDDAKTTPALTEYLLKFR